jgi:hypothetical protein
VLEIKNACILGVLSSLSEWVSALFSDLGCLLLTESGKQHSNRCHMLLDRRSRTGMAFDISRHMNQFDIFEVADEQHSDFVSFDLGFLELAIRSSGVVSNTSPNEDGVPLSLEPKRTLSPNARIALPWRSLSVFFHRGFSERLPAFNSKENQPGATQKTYRSVVGPKKTLRQIGREIQDAETIIYFSSVNRTLYSQTYEARQRALSETIIQKANSLMEVSQYETLLQHSNGFMSQAQSILKKPYREETANDRVYTEIAEISKHWSTKNWREL